MCLAQRVDKIALEEEESKLADSIRDALTTPLEDVQNAIGDPTTRIMSGAKIPAGGAYALALGDALSLE